MKNKINWKEEQEKALKENRAMMRDMMKKDPLTEAAPELLEALKVCEERMTNEMSEAEQLEHDLDGHEPVFCTLCMARAAIAKAEGERHD